MKKLSLTLSCLSLLLILNSCGSGKYTVSPNGDTVDIKLKSGTTFTGEMIFISDTAIVFASIPGASNEKPILFYSLNNEIKSISVQGFEGSGWVAPVLLFQALPAILLAATAASYAEKGEGVIMVGLIMAVPAIITSILFASTEGDIPQWNDDSNTGDIQSLKIYSRYPEGLNKEDLAALLEKYKQKTLKKLS